MTTQDVHGLRLTLSAPDVVPLNRLDPEDPGYDPFSLVVEVQFQNVGEAPLKAPLEEIGGGLVKIFSAPTRPAPIRDNEIPPPPNDGAVIELDPGESFVVRDRFSYPASLPRPERNAPVQLKYCVEWKAGWLRTQNYEAGAVEWNHDFTLCETIEVQQESLRP